MSALHVVEAFDVIEHVGLCFAASVVKHENHTQTCAFKVRGGIVYLDNLKRSRAKVTGVISATVLARPVGNLSRVQDRCPRKTSTMV